MDLGSYLLPCFFIGPHTVGGSVWILKKLSTVKLILLLLPFPSLPFHPPLSQFPTSLTPEHQSTFPLRSSRLNRNKRRPADRRSKREQAYTVTEENAVSCPIMQGEGRGPLSSPLRSIQNDETGDQLWAKTPTMSTGRLHIKDEARGG
jgi:hypothetical protein